MARVVGPMMSFDASGKLANTIVFSKWKGRPYVRQLVTPSNPKSALQTSTRAVMRFLSQIWAGMDPSSKATWNTLADQKTISPFNAFTSFNMNQWTQFLTPSITYPATRDDTSPTFTTLPTPVAGVGQATISYTINAANDGWDLLVFAVPDSSIITSRDNLRLITRIVDPGAQTFVLTGLTPGQWTLDFRSGTLLGKMSAALGDTTITVL